MNYEPFSKIFICNNCSKEEKKRRGCKRSIKSGKVLEIDCLCGGNKHCDLCKGRGRFVLKDCPIRVSSDRDTNRFLPFFWHFKATNYMMYPDGLGRLEQPYKLLEAINICSAMVNKREYEEQKKREAMRK